MQKFIFEEIKKGAWFNSREIVLGFPITDAVVKMDFKLKGSSVKAFGWSTVDDTIEVLDIPTGKILIKGRTLDQAVNTYYSDLKVVFPENLAKYIFNLEQKIIQNSTE